MTFFDIARVFKTYLYPSARFWHVTVSKFETTLFFTNQIIWSVGLSVIEKQYYLLPIISSSLLLS